MTDRTYPKFLPLAKVAEIARDMKQRGPDSTPDADDSRGLVNSYMTWLDRVRALLKIVGDESTCRSCSRTIYWVKTRNGKRAPYTDQGISHFADCPNAAKHRGAKGD